LFFGSELMATSAEECHPCVSRGRACAMVQGYGCDLIEAEP
jgi:hypothetical protein